MAFRILIFSINLTILLVLGVFLPRPWFYYYYFAYYFVTFSFVIWIVLLIKVSYKQILPSLRRHWLALFISISVLIVIFYINPPHFKILPDETNLMGVSKVMYEAKRASLPIQGFGLGERNEYIERTIDQRPLLYPFLVSLLHSLLGYNPSNGFALNFILGISLLFIQYLLIRRVLGQYFGIIGIFLTASFPIFLQYVTSGGFEILNLVFMLFVFLVLHNYIQNRSAGHAELLFMSLVLLAQCRYESVLFFAGLLIGLPYFLNKQTIMSYRLVSFIFPFFLLPLIWQRRIEFFAGGVTINDVYYQPEHIFSLSSFVGNLPYNIFVLSGLDADFGFLPIVSMAACIGFFCVIRKICMNYRDVKIENRVVAVYSFFCFLMIFFLYTAFTWGNFTIAADNRLAIIFLPFLVVSALFALSGPVGRFRRHGYFTRALLVFLVIVQMGYYWPAGVNQRLIKGITLYKEYKEVLGFIHNKHDIKHERILIISDRPSLYLIHNMGSIDYDTAQKHTTHLLFLKNTSFEHIYVLQRYLGTPRCLKANNYLDSTFELKPLSRIELGPNMHMIISDLMIRT